MGYEDDMDDAILQRERRQWIEGTLNDISEDNIRTYLGTYGDSIDGRIKASIRTATNLHAARYHAASVVAGVTAIELVVNYLLVRPLVQSAFMSDEWASLITRKIAFPRTVSDRNILPTILSYKAIEIASIKLKDGRHLWQTVTSEVIPKRNLIVHAGDAASSAEALTAIECATSLRANVALKFAATLGFDLSQKGVWSRIRDGMMQRDFYPEDPF
jgi:hypothetical protein